MTELRQLLRQHVYCCLASPGRPFGDIIFEILVLLLFLDSPPGVFTQIKSIKILTILVILHLPSGLMPYIYIYIANKYGQAGPSWTNNSILRRFPEPNLLFLPRYMNRFCDEFFPHVGSRCECRLTALSNRNCNMISTRLPQVRIQWFVLRSTFAAETSSFPSNLRTNPKASFQTFF